MDRRADIHLTLPQHLLVSLDRVALERGVRRIHLLRTVLEDFLRQVEAERVEQEISDYVDELGPASAEFVCETDVHSVERLLRETEW